MFNFDWRAIFVSWTASFSFSAFGFLPVSCNMFPLQLTMRCLHTLFFPLLHRPSIHLLRLQTGLQFLSRMLLSVCQEQRAAKTLPIQVNLESSFHIFLLRFPRHAF